MRTLGNLLAMGVLIGLALGIPTFIYLALDAILYGLKVVGLFLGGVGLAALGFVGWLKWRQVQDRRDRPVDGSFALRQFKITGGGTLLVDPGKMVSSAGVFHPDYGWQEIEPTGGWQIQQAIALAVQTTRHLQAMTPGDDAHIRTHGAISLGRTGVANAATAKWLEGNYRPKDVRIIGQDPALPAPALPGPRPEIQPQQMIAQAQPTQLVIGQDRESGEIAQLNLELYPFARLHGATQSGKTSLGRFLVAQAIRHGFEVVIYDRRRGKDWGIFGRHAQIVDVRDPNALADALAAEVERYGARDAELGRHNAPNLAALADKTGQAYRRRLIVIEELGTQHMNARGAGKAVYTRFLDNLRRLTAEAGATGIHGLYIDQIPDAWDQGVRYNASGAICFHLPDHGGQVAGYQMAHKLATYHCHFDGQIIRAGHLSEAQIAQTIGGVRVVDAPPVQEVNSPPNSPTNSPATNTRQVLPTAGELREWMAADNERLARQWCAEHPNAGVNSLARQFAEAQGRPDEWRNFQSEASRWWHECNPRGNHYQPQADAHGWIPEPKEKR